MEKFLNIFTQSADVTDKLSAGLGLTEPEAIANAYDSLVENVYSLFTGKDFSGNTKHFANKPGFGTFRDAVLATDMGVLVKDALQYVFREPNEPNLFLLNQVAENLELSSMTQNTRFVTFGAMVAGEVPLTGEYPVATLQSGASETSVSMRKYGLMSVLPDHTVMASNYNLITLTLRMLRNAVDRKAESLLKQTVDNAGRVMFDNNLASTTYHTRGKGIDGTTANYTWSWQDQTDLMAGLMNLQYTPTHLLYHPLAWPVFQLDPILRGQQMLGGRNWELSGTPNAMPFGNGIAYVPYYGAAQSVNATLAGTSPGSTLPSTTLADLTLIDKNHALVFANAGPAEFDSFEDFLHDATKLKVRRWFDAAAKDSGRAIAVAKNIRVETNHEPIFAVKTVTA